MKQDSSQGTYVDIKIKNRGFRFTVPRQYFGHVLVKMNNLKQFTYVLSSSVKCDYSTHRKLTAILWGSNKWPVTRLFRSLYFSHVHQHVAVSILAMLSKLHFSTITVHSLTTLHGLCCTGTLPEVINAAPRLGLSKTAWSLIMSLLSSLDNGGVQALGDCGATSQKQHKFLSDCMKVSPCKLTF